MITTNIIAILQEAGKVIENAKTIWERVADRSVELLMLVALCLFLYKAAWPFFKAVIEKMQAQLDQSSQAREAALKEFLAALERRDLMQKEGLLQQREIAENQRNLTQVIDRLVNKVDRQK